MKCTAALDQYAHHCIGPDAWLPFTGIDLLWVFAIGAWLILIGVLLKLRRG